MDVIFEVERLLFAVAVCLLVNWVMYLAVWDGVSDVVGPLWIGTGATVLAWAFYPLFRRP